MSHNKYRSLKQQDDSDERISINTTTAIPLLVDDYSMDDMSQKQPKLITLFDVNEEVIDLIDSENEDPFMLETFSSIIQEHDNVGKVFILARVVTVDPIDTTRNYYSYYAAHHLNKVCHYFFPLVNLPMTR